MTSCYYKTWRWVVSKKKILVSIIGAGLVGALGAAIGYFPELTKILASISGLITVLIGTINGKDNV